MDEFSFLDSTEEFTFVSLVEEFIPLLSEKVYRWLLQECHQSWLLASMAFPIRLSPGGWCTVRCRAFSALDGLGWSHLIRRLTLSHMSGHLLGTSGDHGEAWLTQELKVDMPPDVIAEGILVLVVDATVDTKPKLFSGLLTSCYFLKASLHFVEVTQAIIPT